LVTGDIAQGVVQTAQVFAQQAKGAGVDVKLRKVTAAELFGPNYLKWTFTQSYWVYNPYFPQVALADLDNSFYQETHYADPRYRKLYFQALATTDEAARREIAHEMQRIYWEGSGYIIPYFAPVIDAHAPNVNGVTEGSLGYSFNLFRFKDVWLA
jgi:peptide/nickel transport system substrate-binding protein